MQQKKSWGSWGVRGVVVVALLGAMLSLGGCGAMLSAVVNGMLGADDDDDFGGSMSMSDGCAHHHHH